MHTLSLRNCVKQADSARIGMLCASCIKMLLCKVSAQYAHVAVVYCIVVYYLSILVLLSVGRCASVNQSALLLIV
jgi:hypothetical protein